jgi:biotin synthase-like enzyme
VKEAYESVDTTRIKTNADQKGYIEQYLNQVKRAEAGVQTVKDRIESANESHKDLVKSYEDKIKTLKTRLATFSGE